MTLSAEYVAYALNYVSALTSSKIAVISWSQGALDIQWALKYWPSTRNVVSDFIAISPHFHGAILKWLACPLLDKLACNSSIWQQGWDANFIQVLRSKGGELCVCSHDHHLLLIRQGLETHEWGECFRSATGLQRGGRIQ